MTLTPFVRTWAPSQRTTLLGGVVQILIYLRLSPCLANVGLFVCINLNIEDPYRLWGLCVVLGANIRVEENTIKIVKMILSLKVYMTYT